MKKKSSDESTAIARPRFEGAFVQSAALIPHDAIIHELSRLCAGGPIDSSLLLYRFLSIAPLSGYNTLARLFFRSLNYLTLRVLTVGVTRS